MMKTLSLCGVLAVLISTSALAQVSPQAADWGQGPAKFLMTKEEAKQWSALQSDKDAQAFIELFWAKRDPTPATPRNEFREDFEARVAFADKTFDDGHNRGALTDRGKVFILLGLPYRVSGQAGAKAEGMGTFAVTPGNEPTNANGQLLLGTATSGKDQQFWMYAHDKKPKFVPQADFTLVFTDEGRGDWRLGTTERVNPEMLFQQASLASIVSPKLTKAPDFTPPAPPPIPRVTSFKSPDLKAAFDQLRSANQPVGSATLTWGEFVTSKGDQFVSAQLYAPTTSGLSAGQKVTFFAVVEDTTGNILDIKESDATMEAAGNGAYIDTSMHLDPGTYTATLGVTSNGKVLAASRAPITVQGLDPAAVAISPMFLASAVYPLKTDWNSTDPFTFGGLKVVPKGDSVFTTSGDLWYFVELRNPGLTDQGKPNVRVGLDISGKTAKGPVALKLPMSDASLAKFMNQTNQYGVGQALPLEGFVPGDYTLKVHIKDVVLGKDYTLEKTFKIQG